MGHIGAIIEKYRQASGMSRKELSEDICSEKHIYFIEKGERSPSANLLKLLGDRLGVNLFDFYQYLDCINPVEVKENIDCFNLYRLKPDVEELKKITEKASKLPDFKKEPWSYEIKLNELVYTVFAEVNYDKAIASAVHILENIEPIYSDAIITANLHILLSTCFFLKGEPNNARSSSLKAYEIVKNKNKMENYTQVLMTARINVLSMHYLLGEYYEVLRAGYEFIADKKEATFVKRLYYIYLYMAFAFYKIDAVEDAIEFFNKGIYMLMFDYSPGDIGFMATYEVFHSLLNDKRMNKGVVSEFKQKYLLK